MSFVYPSHEMYAVEAGPLLRYGSLPLNNMPRVFGASPGGHISAWSLTIEQLIVPVTTVGIRLPVPDVH